MDPKEQKDARTVFVRGLPYDLSDAKLEEIFSEVGPVRRAFTVKKGKDSEKHQGIAFVQFAIAEDAQQAVASKSGTSVQGRKIIVVLAKRRPPLSERLKKKKGVGKPDEQQAQNADAPPKPENVKSEPVQPKKPGKRKQEAEAGPVQAGKPKERKQEAEAGHDKEPKKKKKEKIDPGAATKAWERQKPARTVVIGGLKSKEILKTVVHLAKRLGTVESVQDVPEAELEEHDLSRDGCKPHAVAVLFASVPAARNAVEAFHCQRMGDGDVWARQLGGQGSKWRKWRLIIRNLPFEITEDLLRETFSAAGFVWEVTIPHKPEGESKGFGFISYTNKRDAEEAIKTLNKTMILERPVAVDWSFSRRKYEALAKKADEEDDQTASESESEDVPEGQASDDHDEAESEDSGGEGEDKRSPNEVDVVNRVLNRFLDASTHNQDVKGAERETEKKLDNDKKQTPVKQESKSEEDDTMERTLFLRNLPLDLKVPDLKQRFSAFGVVKALRPVLHPVTKKPKGTAFLEFETREAAEKAAEAAKVGEDGTSTFTISGRPVLAHFAVSRDSARDISKKISKEEEDRDRRNLHLVTEGLIKNGTPAAEGVSEADLAKRKALQLEKATKLRNPIFHVSQTRLAFHNFPKSITEEEVKKLFINAVKSRATKQHPAIKQVKILKDEKEVSRGAGFVEFTEHQHALVALRVLNNNPETFGPRKRPIVEFAIDNMQKLKARESQLQASKQSSPHTSKFKKQDKIGKEPVIPKTKPKRKREEHPDEDKPDTDRAVHPGPKRRKTNKVKQKEVISDEAKQEQRQKQAKAKKPEEKKTKPGKSAAGDKNAEDGRQRRRGPQKEKEIEDRLDKLVSEYRSKYFSGGGSDSKTSSASDPKKSLENIKRWFQ